MKRLSIRFGVIAVFLWIALSCVYLFYPSVYSSFDNKLRDMFFLARGDVADTKSVVIVDIDEKSLHSLGQWPWSRDKIAKIVTNLTRAGAGVIGFDVLFSEPDNTSPAKLIRALHLHISVPDYDQELAKTVAQSPCILGYVAIMHKDGVTPGIPANAPAFFIEKNKPKEEFLPIAYREVLNIPALQESAYSSGFFNTFPDSDGIIRSVPLLMKDANGGVIPSLSLEMIRAAVQVKKVEIDYSQAGIDSVHIGNMTIPTDRFGRLFVNFRGGAKTFPYISAKEVYEGTLPESAVRGKFVLIGTSAAGLLDLRAMPYDSVYPGVEVHANVIDNLIKGDFLYRPDYAEAADIGLLFCTTVVASQAFVALGAVASFVVFVVLTCLCVLLLYYLLFSHGIVLTIIMPLIGIFAIFLVVTVVKFMLESKQKERIKAKFARKVSPAVVEDLLRRSDDNTRLEATQKRVTVFFSDIRGFTSISEAAESAHALIELLNEYMTPMAEIIAQSSGTIDKFIGDAIMAYWNAPNDVANHEDASVQAALSQFAALKELNREFARVHKPSIDIGIGINTGEVVVGEMGSLGRADYTIIGDTVNVASRLEGLCKAYHAHIIISEFTREGLKASYVMRELDLVRVKGKEEPIAIYEVLAHGEPTDSFVAELNAYDEALLLYRNGLFTQAKERFSYLIQTYDAYIYRLYEERCRRFEEYPPEDFSGVYTFTEK